MFNPLAIDAPYSRLQFIENLAVYATCKGTDEMLDLVREIQESGNYYWQGVVFPNNAITTVGGQSTVNGSIQVPVGTYVTSITHFCSQAQGFKFKLYDKGTKASIFYGDYSKSPIVSADMLISQSPPTDAGSNLDDPFGPGYLMSPFIITNPGVLGWEVVNMSVLTATIQVMLACAVPINSRSIGKNDIRKG